MSNFLHNADDDAKAIAILRVFSENSQAKNEIGIYGRMVLECLMLLIPLISLSFVQRIS